MDTPKFSVQYNLSGKKREETNQEISQEVGREGLRRQSIERLIWLDEEIETTNNPRNTKAIILGVCDVETRYSMIYLIIDHNHTEYRITRYNKQIIPIIKTEIDDLKHAHRNMINHFISTYAGKDFKALLKQWIIWCDNKAYNAVLSKLL